MDDRVKDIEDFQSILWEEYISQFMVSDAYLAKHDDFIRELTFDMWNIYNKDKSLTLRCVARITEAFFKNLFTYQASNIDLSEKFFQ